MANRRVIADSQSVKGLAKAPVRVVVKTFLVDPVLAVLELA